MHESSQDHVFFDGLLDIWYFSWRTPDTWLAPPHRSRSANFPLLSNSIPLLIFTITSLIFLCRVQMPSCNKGWLTEGKAETAVSQHPARESIHQSVRSLALSPARPITSSSLPPLLLSLLAPQPCPFPADTIKTRGWDRSIGIGELSVTKVKLVCCCPSSVSHSAKVGLFCKPDPDHPLHSLFLYFSFSCASLRGREQTDTLHHSE